MLGLNNESLGDAVSSFEAQEAAVARCPTCNEWIMLGAKRWGDVKFCSDRCLVEARCEAVASRLPAELIEEQVHLVHQAACPVCGGAGPVDLHLSHRVWSIVFLTTSVDDPRVSCRRCAVGVKLRDSLFSGLFGWWGLPMGLLLTPAQIYRNVAGLFTLPAPDSPSPPFVAHIRRCLAQEAWEEMEVEALEGEEPADSNEEALLVGV